MGALFPLRNRLFISIYLIKKCKTHNTTTSSLCKLRNYRFLTAQLNYPKPMVKALFARSTGNYRPRVVKARTQNEKIARRSPTVGREPRWANEFSRRNPFNNWPKRNLSNSENWFFPCSLLADFFIFNRGWLCASLSLYLTHHHSTLDCMAQLTLFFIINPILFLHIYLFSKAHSSTFSI